MKNLQKLLVTVLALVLLICGATVVSFAADTPAEIMAEAQILFDQATKDGEFIAVRSQKMRELDKLIDSKMSTIRNSQEWRDFQVGYKAAQNKLKEDCIIEANASFDKLMDKNIASSEATILYSGLAMLVSTTNDNRGYFNTDSAEFEALKTRLVVAETLAKLQYAEDAGLAKERGSALLWVYNQKVNVLDKDEAVLLTAEYGLIQPWFDEIYAVTADALYAEIAAMAEEASLATTKFDRALQLCGSIDEYFTSCYLKSDQVRTAARQNANMAIALTYLNQIERTKVLISQGEYLKALSEQLSLLSLDKKSEAYANFKARYDVLLDEENPSSIVSRLCKLADGYQKDIADVFVDGYNGPLQSASQISDVVDEMEALVLNCYFEDKSYVNAIAVGRGYVAVYDFYVAIRDMENHPENYGARNALYKKAVASYTALSTSIAVADAAYKAPFLAVYENACAKAKAEIHAVLSGWLLIANSSNQMNTDGVYKYSFEEVREAYENLAVYYLEKTTAYYFSATEDKSLTSNVKKASNTSENRLARELQDMLSDIQALYVLPEDLAQADADVLALRAEAVDVLLVQSAGLKFIYGENPDVLKEFYHKLYVVKLVTLVCQIELEYAKDDHGESLVIYNELKAFALEHSAAITVDAEDYLAYLSYLNKIEVKMGNENVPGARPYLDALAEVVDEDSFDKVYALMHLDEYVRNYKIARPDSSDTTSASALFYQEYDELAGKVKAWRQAIVDEREKNVSLSDYNGAAGNYYDGDEKQATAQKNNHTFTSKDGRHYGANGSEYYTTFEYTKGSSADGYIAVNLPSSTANVIIEMDITTFTNWPTKGVSFNSGTNTLETNTRIYPWLGAIDSAGQIVAPNGKNHSWGPVLTSREGGYIIPGQWTHFVIVYNALEKTVSYYVNDEKIVDANGKDSWSCANATGSYNFNEALRIGHANSGGGSFSLDNVRLYVGDQPRDMDLFKNMSDIKKFDYYTNYAKEYIDNKIGTAADAKMCYEENLALYVLYWGIANEGDTEMTYLFDENTYWADGADPGITYEEFKQTIKNFLYVMEKADAVIEGALIEAVFNDIKDYIAQLETLVGLDNLSKRKALMATMDAYITNNESYIKQFSETQVQEYEVLSEKKDAIQKEIDAYARADEYINAVKKFVAAKNLYSRMVARDEALRLMTEMERDDALGYFDLDLIKSEVTTFTEAIATYEEQDALLNRHITEDNNNIIIDCMGRFPASVDEAMKKYASLNKYIVLVRRILLEGNYDEDNIYVQEALDVYNRMNEAFYDALQKDHASTVQDLIDRFDTETSFITRLGIYNAVKKYLAENESTIDRDHDAIKGIYSQYELMDEKFGTEEGQELQWKEYGKILEANTLRFVNLVLQIRFCETYAELRELREQAALLYYYMDSTSADAKLAVEYYQACEVALVQSAVLGDRFIEAAYALKKASGMQDVYRALVAAKAAFALVDPTYDGTLTFYETVEKTEIAVAFSMADAIETYQIVLSQYSSFVTIINHEVNGVLDIVCAVRANFSVNQPVVALFKKFYD